jgi:sphingomyelin phosphodiesterase
MGYCDIPASVLYKMGDKINELAPDVLFYTGDVPPHDQWNYNFEEEVRYQNFLFDYMTANLTSWSTFPLEGNHDFAIVINSQDLDSDIPDPTITLLADKWNVWLDENSIEQFMKNGCYVQSVKLSDGTDMPKVKVVAINSEASYNFNFFLITNRNDPGGILAWLEATLTEMEANDEIAILIGHSPLNDVSMLSGWAKRFQALMERF